MLTTGAHKKKAAKPPPPDQYIVNHPYIAPMDMDIIKLTAQFVARNGQKFLIGLTQRESRNPQFDFLKPTHALFGYFTSLVDAYTKCLMPNKDELEKMKKYVNTHTELLDRAMARFAWDEQEDGQRQAKDEEEKEEKDQMHMIDWHDFVVVETIEFTAEDNNIPLAAPIDVATGAPQGPPQALDSAGTVTQQARIEKPKEDEEADEVDVEKEKQDREKREREREEREKEEKEKEKEEREREERERLEAEAAQEEEPMELEPEIPLPAQDPEMKVRKDYIRHKKASSQRLMQRCPITGQLIPAEEMSTHLKVLLLDPKWKHQKDALVERARKESAFADDVEANLAGFVAKRPDLFGSVDEQIREAAEAGAEAAARDAGADAGPAHTMVPALAAAAATKNAPALAAGSANAPALAAAAAAGPVTGMSSVNSRLPSASLNPQGQKQPYGGMMQIGNAGDDDDEDDEPNAKKPRLDDGSLQPEAQWLQKHPHPIQIIVQVDLGADGKAAGVPTAIPLEIPVRSKVLDMKQQLLPKVMNAGVNLGAMRLRAQGPGYLLKNTQTLAFYNIAPGSIIELTKKIRGGK